MVGDYFSLAMEPKKKAKVDEANSKFAKAILRAQSLVSESLVPRRKNRGGGVGNPRFFCPGTRLCAEIFWTRQRTYVFTYVTIYKDYVIWIHSIRAMTDNWTFSLAVVVNLLHYVR